MRVQALQTTPKIQFSGKIPVFYPADIPLDEFVAQAEPDHFSLTLPLNPSLIARIERLMVRGKYATVQDAIVDALSRRDKGLARQHKKAGLKT